MMQAIEFEVLAPSARAVGMRPAATFCEGDFILRWSAVHASRENFRRPEPATESMPSLLVVHFRIRTPALRSCFYHPRRHDTLKPVTDPDCPCAF